MSAERRGSLAREADVDDLIAAEPLIREDEEFVRMTAGERAQHALLVVTFVTLVITGFPLAYPNARIWNVLHLTGETFWVRSLLHRIAGVGLAIVSLWHLAYVLLTETGSRYFREMMPRTLDAWQLVEAFMHKLGLMDWLYRRGIARRLMERHPWWRFAAPPEYGRYNWIEKFEYLAVVWGNLVMIVTGLALWFFQATFALFPKPVFDIIKLVHGFEALLAFLAIAIWHMYNVHLNPEAFPMSRIWLDGKVTGAQLRHHYPGWYRQIEAERLEQRRIQRALRLYAEAGHMAPAGPGGPRDGGHGPRARG